MVYARPKSIDDGPPDSGAGVSRRERKHRFRKREREEGDLPCVPTVGAREEERFEVRPTATPERRDRHPYAPRHAPGAVPGPPSGPGPAVGSAPGAPVPGEGISDLPVMPPRNGPSVSGRDDSILPPGRSAREPEHPEQPGVEKPMAPSPGPPLPPPPEPPLPRAPRPETATRPEVAPEQPGVEKPPAPEPGPPLPRPGPPPPPRQPQAAPRPETSVEGVPPQHAAAPGPPPGYFYPPPWYPVPFMHPGPGYGMPYGTMGVFPEMPVPPYGQVPGVGMPPPWPGYGQAPFMPSPPGPLEDEGFERLAAPRTGHWRGDLKWVFGALATLLLFLTLLSAGLYRATAPGAARRLLVPLLEDSTSIEKTVKENYRDLQDRARRLRGGSLTVPDIGVSVGVEARDVRSMSREELASAVLAEAGKQVYQRGGAGGIPAEPARGAGEQRAKAVCVTLMSTINSGNHSTLLWVLIACGFLTLVFGAVFIVFCDGWGKLIGSGIVFAAAALPAALTIRMADEFIWKPGASGYGGAMSAALRQLGSQAVIFFDVALGVGGLLLLAGIVANVIAKKSRERVPPFTELGRLEEDVAGGGSLEQGLEPEDEDGDEDLPVAPFADLAPAPGDSIKNP